MQYKFPLNEVATEFFDELKSVSSGYASFDYEDAGYVPSDLGKAKSYIYLKDYKSGKLTFGKRSDFFSSCC